nr:integrase, catalytic region, zinc finger, CCHC-type, peptidase aspartic, catalytic [Tanacetum cinerariifolium]
MDDVNVNALADQAPTMAPPTRTDDRILPHIRWVPIGKSNCYLDIERSQSNPMYKIAQFWDIVRYDKTVGCYKCQLDKKWFDLTKYTLRDALQITPVNNNNSFSSPSSFDALIYFVNELGYLKVVRNLSNVVTNDMFQSWRALTTIINLCLTRKNSGFKRPKAPRKHKFHPRPYSPLHLPNEEPVLGYLKFFAKGTKQEVFGMPIPDNLITADIQGEPYYKEYLEKVPKHQRYLVGEKGSDPDSPALKPAKATKKSKPSAPKADLRPTIIIPASTRQPKPKPAPANSLRSVDESVDEGIPEKVPRFDDEEADIQRAVEESLKSVYDAPRGLLPPVVTREPESGKYEPLPEVQEKGKEKVTDEHVALDLLTLQTPKKKSHADQFIFQRRTSTPTESFGHDGSSSLSAKLGLTDNEGFTATAYPEVEENLKLTVEEQVILEELASSTGTLSSLQHLAKDLSIGDLFFNDKPSEVDNEKTTAEIKAESMVFVTIQQDTSIPMKTLIINLTSRPDSLNIQDNKHLEERLDSHKARLYTLENLDIPQRPPPPPPPVGPSGTSRSLKASGSSQVLPPPLPPPSTNQEGQSHGSTAPSSSKTAALAEYKTWTMNDTRIRLCVSSTPSDLHIDEDMALDAQIHSSDDEDIENAYILKASALASTYSPLPEDSLLTRTGDMAMFMDWFCKRKGITKHRPQDLEGPAFEIIKVFHPNVIHLQYQMEECHKILTDSVDDSIIKHNVSKPLPLGGPPGQMKATYYPDVSLEQMVPDQMWIEEECKHTSKGDRRAVRTHMQILSVVRIEVFSMYGYDYMKTIVLCRADLNEHIIAKRDFKYLYPSDFEDLYLLNLQGHLNHLPLKDKKILTIAVNLCTRHLVIRQRVKDFQLGIESYQTQLNLPNLDWMPSALNISTTTHVMDPVTHKFNPPLPFKVAVCSNLRPLKPKRIIESRAKRSSNIISLGHYYIMLASSYSVKSKIDIKSPTHYPRGEQPRGGGAAGYGGIQNRVENANPGQARQNSDNYKDKILLMQVQENRVALDKEHLLFLAGGQDNAIDEDVHDHDHYQDVVSEHHEEHTMHDNVQLNHVVDSYVDYTSDNNMILYDQYVKDNAVPGVHSNVSYVPNDVCMMIYNDMYEPHAQSVSKTSRNIVVKNSLTAELTTYKEQVELHERRARFELIKREQKINEQLRIVITNHNFKEEMLKKELHSIKLQLASTINHNKLMVEEVTSLKKDFKQKENKYLEYFLAIKSLKEKVKDRLFKQDQSLQIVHMLCRPKPYYKDLNKAIVHNTKDTIEIAKITRRKINDKIKDPECVNHKVKIAPHDYLKENFLATFTPQKQLTPEQIFWSQDLIKMKIKALKEQTTTSRPIKALTVYPLSTPVTLVPSVLPTNSQVKIHILHSSNSFQNLIKPEHFEGIQKALTKEIKKIKDVFEELEAEVAQNVVDRKHDEIEQKNLLTAKDKLIAECLSKEVFSVAMKSELNVARFTKMHVANTIVEARCLEVKAELSTLHDKSHNGNQNELVNSFSNLEVTALTTENVNLKAQILNTVNRVSKDHVKPTVLAPGKYTIDVEPIPSRLRNNMDAHLDYLRHLKENVETICDIVEEAKVVRPLDSSIVSACRYTKHS